MKFLQRQTSADLNQDATVWWHACDEYNLEELPMTVVGLRAEVDALILIGDRWQAPLTSLAGAGESQYLILFNQVVLQRWKLVTPHSLR